MRQSYLKNAALMTGADVLLRLAGMGENNTSGYITRVCREMQVPTTYVPDVEDKGTMCALAAAISVVENGIPAVMADVEAGWELLNE